MVRLRRSNLNQGGYSRSLDGEVLVYRDPSGRRVQDPELCQRFDQLAIPPAWSEVWISPHPNGHIQSTGLDGAGRRQYIYHEAWSRRAARVKFERAQALAEGLPSARARVTRDLRTSGLTRERALAAAFRMLDTGLLRIGNERYAQANGTRGLSTLLCEDAVVSRSTVHLSFPAKSGQFWESEIADPDLVRYVRQSVSRRREGRLLIWNDDGTSRFLSAQEINEYVKLRTGGDFTAKDFRTLHGTEAAAVSLARHGVEKTQRAKTAAIAEAMRDAATVLGNTPAIARKSYVDPRVVDRYRAGDVIDLSRGTSPTREVHRLLQG